jgi:hypothetical protein
VRARDRVALVLFAVAALAGAYAALIAWTGGFDLGVMGLRIRSRTWLRAAVIALIAAAGFIAAARARLAAALRVRAKISTINVSDLTHYQPFRQTV